MARLPPFPRLGLERITRVQSADDALLAWKTLRDSPVWGFDTESKPTFLKNESSDGPHVLQLATLTHAWVIQLADPACRDMVAGWMELPDFVKAGFGLGDDNRRMVRKFGIAPCNVLDLNTLFRERGHRKELGVKAAVATLFQQHFVKSKKTSTSNWSAARLTDAQLVYAANDAYAAAHVFHALAGVP
jgi:ribonuclease D